MKKIDIKTTKIDDGTKYNVTITDPLFDREVYLLSSSNRHPFQASHKGIISDEAAPAIPTSNL